MIYKQIDPKFGNFNKFSDNIKKSFEQEANTITKKRNVIKLINFDNKKIVVKSFKIPNIVNKFAYRFIRDSKAKRSFYNAQKLIQLGINTPHPIAFVEFFTPLLDNSFYICKYFDHDFEIRDVLKNQTFKNRDKILKQFTEFSYLLHEKGVYHVDYSPGNILVKQINENEYLFSIVDVNRMKFIKFNDSLRFKNLAKLSASEEDIKFISKIYAAISDMDELSVTKKLFFYHNKHQKYLQNKKILKTLKF